MSEWRTLQRFFSPGRGWVCALALVTCVVWACAPPVPATGTVSVLFFGDSLTAGLGVRADQAFPARVASQLSEQGWDITIIDAGRNGDTTAGGRARLGTWMDRRPDVAVIQLGGNDGLQRLSLAEMEANLSAIVEALQARGIRVALLGVELPFFLGDTSGFRAVYGRVAAEHDVPLLDNVLEDVLGYPGRMQTDGIHPTPEGHAIMAQRVTDFLQSSGVLH